MSPGIWLGEHTPKSGLSWATLMNFGEPAFSNVGQGMLVEPLEAVWC